MRVVLDATPLGSGRGGDETYLRGLLAGLASTDPDGTTFPVLLADSEPTPESIYGRPDFPAARLTMRPGPWHFSVSLPAAARRFGRPDLVHSLTHAVPAFWGLPTALTVGDLSFLHRPQDYPPAVRARLNTLVPRQVRRARVVLAPSAFSRCDIIDSYGVSPDKVHVVSNCLRPLPPLTEAEVTEADRVLVEHGLAEPFLLYLGNLHPRKNVERLVAAYAAAAATSAEVRKYRLVIAGQAWWRPGAATDPPGVLRLGRVSEPVRRRLLERAIALAYLSLFEGFGLPPLEAMQAGTPVLASRIPAIEEVCADAALLVDPFDVDAIAGGITALLETAELRSRLAVRGRRRARLYDVAATGRSARAAFHWAREAA